MASPYEVQVTVASAKKIKDVNWRHGHNRPYAVAWVEPMDKRTTMVDEEGDTKPTWNETFVIPLPTGPISDATRLCIDLVHCGEEEGTKPLIGSTQLNVMEVVEEVGMGQRACRKLKLKRPSGRDQGKVKVEVEVREASYGGFELEVQILEAKNIQNVNWRHGPNKPYAVVWVEPKDKRTTKVDEEGHKKPAWNETFVLPLPPRPIDDDTKLCIDLVHEGNEEGTEPFIGYARLNLKEVVEEVGMGERVERELKLKRPSGREHGKIEVIVEVRERSHTARGGHFPPHYAYPYDDPYAAPEAGYHHGEYHHEEEEKKSHFGGMATGLAIGAGVGLVGGVALAAGIEALDDSEHSEENEEEEEEVGDDE